MAVSTLTVTTSLINAQTLQEISNTSSTVAVNNNQYLFFKVTGSLTDETKIVKKAVITFKQYASLNYNIHFYESNSAHLISSNELNTVKTVNPSTNLVTYEVDITDLIGPECTGDHYFMLTTESEMSFYTSYAGLLYKPTGALNLVDDNSKKYVCVDRPSSLNKQIKDLSVNLNLFSLKYIASLSIHEFKNELAALPISLIYNLAQHETTTFNTNVSTYFPRGWKLNIQQYLYYNSGSNTYTYIDSDYLLHTFALPTGTTSGSIYYDNSGSYLILQIVNSVPQIISPNGDTLVFTNGYLSQIKIKKPNGYYCFNLTYDSNNKLTSVTDNSSSVILSLTYSTSNIVIKLFNNSSKIFTLNVNSNNLLTSIVDPVSETYSLSYYSASTKRYLSSLSLGNRSLTFSFNSDYKVTSINEKENSSFVNYLSIQKKSTFTLLNTKPGNNSSLTRKTLYEFDNDMNLIKETIIYDNAIDSSKYHFDKGRVNYDLSSSPIKINEDLSYNNSPLSVPFNIDTYNSVDLSISENVMSYLYIELNVTFPSNCTNSILDAVSINVYRGSNNLVGSFIQQISHLSNKYALFVPLDKQDVLSSSVDHFNIQFSHSNSEATITITKLERKFWGEPVNSFEYVANNGLYNFYNNIVSALTQNNYITLNVNGTNRQLSIYPNDYNNSSIYHNFRNLHLLFTDKGRTMYLITNGNYSLASYRLLETTYNRVIDEDSTDVNGDEINYQTTNNILYTFTSSELLITNNKRDCFFLVTVQTHKKYNSNLLLTEEIDENGATHNYSYDSYGNQLCSTSSKDGTIVEGITYTYSSNGEEMTRMSLGGNNFFRVDYSYNSYKKLYSRTTVNQLSKVHQYNNNFELTSISQNDIVNKMEYSSGQLSKAYNSVSNVNKNIMQFSNGVLSSSRTWTNITLSSSTTFSSSGVLITNALPNSGSESITYNKKGQISLYDEGRTTKLYYNYFGSLAYDIIDNTSNTILGNIERREFLYKATGSLLGIKENKIKYTISYDFDNATSTGEQAFITKYTYLENIGSSFPPLYTSERVESAYSYSDTSKGKRLITTFYNSQYVSSRIENVSMSSRETVIVGSSNNINSSYVFANTLKDKNTTTKHPVIEESYFTTTSSQIKLGIVNYTYNNTGNITSIISPSLYYGFSYEYSYDSYNRLSSETNNKLGNSSYQFDSMGNILSITRGNNTITFTYSDKNIIIFVTGPGISYSFSYDVYGYPIVHKNNILSWFNNKLTQYENYYFTYDGFNRRLEKKLNNNNKSTYTYSVDKLLIETKTIDGVDYKLQYIYNPNNEIIGFRLNNETIYIYRKDILGNVIAIYDQSGACVTRYFYDAYGNHKVFDGFGLLEQTSPTFIGNLNPIRYRSYYYDNETGLYYLKYRYYDPEICRFISPDSLSYIETDKPFGINLYTYCYNNPIAYKDPEGHSILLTALLGLFIGAFASFAVELIKQYKNSGGDSNKLDWTAIWRQTIIGGAIGFAASAGAAALGGYLLGTATTSGVKVLTWLGISATVSCAGGIAAYAVETFGHGSEWDTGEAFLSGFLGLIAGIVAFGAGGISKLVEGKTIFLVNPVELFTKTTFSFPLKFIEGFVIDYLS